ncbi:hypothetical protein CLV88_11646 [Shimia abyssi]|uniref:Uncharacterized protein n=1 Tax=Shimia abyssi TaxID=1662395 RepID=A0A2P8F799_9RHOB|nr:hypothetical protein CLV88_11646 [Shimia abyssi]
MGTSNYSDEFKQDDRLASQARKPGDSAFRSGLAIHQPGVADVPSSAQPGSQYEPTRELP